MSSLKKVIIVDKYCLLINAHILISVYNNIISHLFSVCIRLINDKLGFQVKCYQIHYSYDNRLSSLNVLYNQ